MLCLNYGFRVVKSYLSCGFKHGVLEFLQLMFKFRLFDILRKVALYVANRQIIRQTEGQTNGQANRKAGKLA